MVVATNALVRDAMGHFVLELVTIRRSTSAKPRLWSKTAWPWLMTPMEIPAVPPMSRRASIWGRILSNLLRNALDDEPAIYLGM